MRKRRYFKTVSHWLLLLLIAVFGISLTAASPGVESEAVPMSEIEAVVADLMNKGDIPGLTLVVVREDRPIYIKGFGLADPEAKQPVTADTRFQLASTSKAFTALAALKCRDDGLLRLDNTISDFFPDFTATFEGKSYPITLEQLLHQTSGIPVTALSVIEAGSGDDALQQTVKRLSGIQLNRMPGTGYEYSTVNYAVMGAIIEKVSGLSFEKYMTVNIFEPLGLSQTIVDTGKTPQADGQSVAAGHKIGFFIARRYDAPDFRGNGPAGYIASTGKDMARWVQLQLGMEQNPVLSPLISETHKRDTTVSPNPMDMNSYAMGWQVSVSGNGIIQHSGMNPNFSARVILRPQKKTGIAVLANSNSGYTDYIGTAVMNLLFGVRDYPAYVPAGNIDKNASVVVIFFSFVVLCIVAFILMIFLDLAKGKRGFDGFSFKKILKLVGVPIAMAPFLYGIYLIPKVIMNFSWDLALIWAPSSFIVAVYAFVAIFAGIYIGYFLSLLFPMRNKYLRSAPLILVMGIATGAANAVVIFLITIALYSKIQLYYLVYYFVLALVIYIAGRKLLQSRLAQLAQDIVYDMRMKLIEKIFYTSYQRFEKIEEGRVLATVNNDTGLVGGTAHTIVAVVTSLVTVLGVFIYLATIAFWATAVTLLAVIFIAALYYYVSGKANAYFQGARDAQDSFMDLLKGIQDGYKELSLHYNKKKEYGDELDATCDTFRKKNLLAIIKFINSSLVGEALLIIVLGCVGFAVPTIFPDIPLFTLMSFIIALLYLIGPVNGILGAIPGIMQIRIAWGRVNQFMAEIPANMDPGQLAQLDHNKTQIKTLEAKNVFFKYESDDEGKSFSVGPLDFNAQKGKIIFIVGGNGSGKTTLAKLLTGLYIPEKGSILADGKEVHNCELSEYFSVIFSDFHLFRSIYNVDMKKNYDKALQLLKTLDLQDKVKIKGNTFSTLDLSSGQRKRLALMQCYLEDRPVYLFDELAADQDPQFRKFFYRELLMGMKERGKIVIAVTHDDHYFDVADEVIKMDMGKVERVEEGSAFRVTA